MTTTETLIYEILAVVASGAIAYLSAYAKTYIQTHTKIAGYEFDNDRLERILANAVAYVDAEMHRMNYEIAKDLAKSEKLGIAREYINKIDANIIKTYGDELDVMLTRKATQLGVETGRI